MKLKGHQLLVGTSKGLVVYQKKETWSVEQTHFIGMPVSFVFVDERTNTWWVGLAHRHWGQKLHRSNDQGNNWTQVATPVYPEWALLKPGKPAKLKRVWCMAHGGVDQPEVLYIGTEPGGLFKSTDYGESFHLVEDLWKHPSRKHEWFGAGRDHPFIHSINVDPNDSHHFYISISCAGVFETTDNGRHWEPKNRGLIATYLPNPNIEVGHDPHLVLLVDREPQVMWQQNHCGIFRSTDSGGTWKNVTGKNGFPNYGFALAIDPLNPLRAWVIPATSDTMRVAVDLALCVCRTEDGGETWRKLTSGLPQDHCFDIVFRHAFVRRATTMAFGTSTGNLFVSENDGDHWQHLHGFLPRIDALAFG